MSQITAAVALWGGVAALLSKAAVYDWKYRQIPNWLTLTGAIYAFFYWSHLSGWQGALTKLGIGLGIGFILYVSGFSQAGDAKLMAVLSALIGPAGMFLTLAGAYASLLLYVVPRRIRRLGLKGFIECEKQGFRHVLYLRSVDADDAPREVERAPLGPFFLPGVLLALLIH